MVESSTLLLSVITILTAIFIWSRRTHFYWQRRRIKFVQPTHLLGNLKSVLKLETSFSLQLREFYFDKRFEAEPLVGIYLFHQPALLIRDLELVRRVLIDDFISFSNRFARCDMRKDKLGALNLFFAKQTEWREIRTKLSPTFTSGKIRQMFALMEEVGYDLEVYLNKLTNNINRRSCVVQVKDICDLYNTDMIASIAFGMRSYSLRNTESNHMHGKSQLCITSFKRAVNFFVIFFLPKLVPFLQPKLFTPEYSEFLRQSIIYMLEERERTGELRNDLIETLITLRKETDLNKDKSHFMHRKDFLIAQAGIFEIGGIQPCAATMAFALYELAKQTQLQTRLREEIKQTYERHKGSLSYDAVLQMQYLDMVVAETLRMYPAVPFLERECTPIHKKRFYSFRPRVECFVRRGMPVFISNFAIHHDARYWPKPDLFDPERFAPANKINITPLSYLPFGAGSRNCIGMALAQLQIKLGLVHFLKEHSVELCEKTVRDIKFDPRCILLSQEGELYLRISKYSL